MDSAGVDAALLVAPAFAAEDADEVVLQAAAAWPHRFAAVCRMDASQPERTVAALRTWRRRSGCIGFRILLARQGDGRRGHTVWASRDSLDWLWREVADSGAPLIVYCPQLLYQLADIARRFPEVRIVVDHLGLPLTATGAAAGVHISRLRHLAELPNVALKATAIPCYADELYPYPAFQGYLQQIVGWFGAERLFWASDLTRLPCSYSLLVDFYRSELPFLDDAARHAILGEGARAWFGWPRATPSRASG